jgi:predicted amidohydrolase YtcJ
MSEERAVIIRVRFVIVAFLLASGVFGAAATQAQRGERAAPPDLIIHNGRVYVGPGQPRAEAVAVAGNRIVRVGTSAAIRQLAGPATAMIDARGGAVLPGFNDSHLHFISGGLGLDRVNLLDAETLDAIRKKIREFAAANPSAPWVQGRGWYYSPFPGGLPTRQQLDELVPDRPAYMRCYDGHTGWANTKALQLAGITRDTPDPTDGIVVKDPITGEPTGVLKEAAQRLMSKVLPKTTREDQLRAVSAAVGEANRLGITSIQEAGTSDAELALFEEVRRNGGLTVRVYGALSVDERLNDAEADKLDAIRARYAKDPIIRVGAVKIMLDGVVEAHTAAMLAPYSNKDSVGHANYTPDELKRIVTLVDKRGWQVFTHAIGDGAVRMTLDAYEQAARVNPPLAQGRRHRIEHAETIDPADIPRFGKLGVIASYMPFHANPSPAQLDVWSANLGPARSARGWICRTLIDAGARLTFGSDWPVVSLDPRLEVNMAVTRRTPEGLPPAGWNAREAIGLETAIDAETSGAAFASFEESRKGRIAPGLLADIVVLSTDIFSAPPAGFLGGVVETTIFDGKVVYRRK